MRLTRVRLTRFRNIASAEFVVGARATLLVGSNGQGKTNCLEAIYFAATLRPLRATRASELIQFGTQGQGTRVELTLASSAEERTLGCGFEGTERVLWLDGVRTTDLETYVEAMAVVAFAPDDLQLVKGAPEDRRRFVERTTFGRFPAYLGEARGYLRALKNRNQLLREGAPDALRSVFDEAVVRTGARLWSRRIQVVAELAPLATEAFERIGRVSGGLQAEYRVAGLDGEVLTPGTPLEELENRLRVLLEERLGLDRQRGFTTAGPHADDLSLKLGGRAARLYASQGQQRAIVLALKMAEIRNLREQRGIDPVVLLDDVSSELDPERNRALLEYLRGSDLQVVLSTTDAGLVTEAAGGDAVRLDVRGGELREGG